MSDSFLCIVGVEGDRPEAAVSGNGGKSDSNRQDGGAIERGVSSVHGEPSGISSARPGPEPRAVCPAVVHARTKGSSRPESRLFCRRYASRIRTRRLHNRRQLD